MGRPHSGRRRLIALVEGKHLPGLHAQADHGKRPGRDRSKLVAGIRTKGARARIDGARAAKADRDADANPHGVATAAERYLHTEWLRGWRDGPR